MKLRKYAAAVVFVLVLTVICGALMPNQVAAENGVITLTADAASKTISVDTVLDLNGYDITTLTVESGATVLVKDSQTDDYTVEDGVGYGKITTVNGNVKAADGYLMVTEDGESSVHKLTMCVSGATLRTAKNAAEGTGIYYTCTFGGDEIVKQNVKAFGVAMGAGRNPDFRAGTYTQRTTDAWSVGGEFEGNSTLLKGIMKTENAYSVNVRNSGINVHCQAFVQLNNNQRVTGEIKRISLHNFVERVDSLVSGFDDDQEAAAIRLYSSFEDIVDTWCVPQIRQLVTGGAYQIRNPRDLKVLNELPDASYVLTKDLNMKGVDFTPVESFSGTFEGNDYAISNLTVDVDSGNYVGMFTQIAEGGTVSNLHLQNVTVDATGSDARFVGTIAGRTYGTISGCTVTGTISHDRVGSTSSLTFIGAFAGRSESGSSTIGDASLSTVNTVKDVTGKEKTYTTTGLSAKVKILAPDDGSVAKRLVGNFSGGGTRSGVWQDLSFASDTQDPELQRRRETAVNYAYESGTIKWTPASQIEYWHDGEARKDTDVHHQIFYQNEVYVGIPYTHCSSSLEQAMHYMPTKNSNGIPVLSSEVTKLTGGLQGYSDYYGEGLSCWQSTNGKYTRVIGWGEYLGSDCTSALTMAWHKVSPVMGTDKDSGGVCLLYSSDMVPSQANQFYHGFRQVGNYTVDDATLSGGLIEKDSNGKELSYTGTSDGRSKTEKRYALSTRMIINSIGKQETYEAYARTMKGDILVCGSGAGIQSGSSNHAISGHARMAAMDAVVIRNADGTIDPAKSYFVTHEQGDGLYERSTTNSSWRINYKYTFAQLADAATSQTGSKGYYLPITMPAFHDVNVNTVNGTVEGKVYSSTLGNCVISATDRILCVTLTNKSTGASVTRFVGACGNQNYRRGIVGYTKMPLSTLFSEYKNYSTANYTITYMTYGSSTVHTFTQN